MLTPKLVPEIPHILHSFDTDRPFDTCLVCGKELFMADEEYIIEKSFRRFSEYGADDVAFEYAICIECVQNLNRSYSRESMQKLERYFSENVDFEARHENFYDQEDYEFLDWTAQCVVKGTPKEALREYQIAAHCRGSQMIYSHFPFVIGGAAMDEIIDLMSSETLNAMNDFVGNYLGISPEVLSPEDSPRIVLL